MTDNKDVVIAVEDETGPSGIILQPGALTWKTDIIPVVAGVDNYNTVGKTTEIYRVGNEIHAKIELLEEFSDAFKDMTDVSFSYFIDGIENSSENPNTVTKARLRCVAIIPSLKIPSGNI